MVSLQHHPTCRQRRAWGAGADQWRDGSNRLGAPAVLCRCGGGGNGSGEHEKPGAMKSIGASAVIDYERSDFTRQAEEAAYDGVFDAVGKSTFGASKRLLKPNGIYCSSELGPGWQNIPLSLAGPLMRGPKVVFPLPGAEGTVPLVRSPADRGGSVSAAHRPQVHARRNSGSIRIRGFGTEDGQSRAEPGVGAFCPEPGVGDRLRHTALSTTAPASTTRGRGSSHAGTEAPAPTVLLALPMRT